MIRSVVVVAIASAGLLAGLYFRTSHAPIAASAAGSPSPLPVPATFFGLSVLSFPQLAPSLRFGTTRSWDAGPGLDWTEANPSPGVYNFSALDRFIAFNKARGAEGIYTFGRTPRWASSRPDDPGSPYGPGQCAAPASMKYWDDYVTAIATHAAGGIKYWELWNEPNEQGYCGDIATMVLMAQHAARILKKIDPSALVLTPSADKASGPAWLAEFLSAGGAKAVDVIAFHGYWSDKAEDIVRVVAGFRAAAAANGLSTLPLWDTEVSWAYTSNMSLPPLPEQAGYIAKSFLLHWSTGVARTVWYAYDGNSPWGTLYTPAGETPAAFAYGQTFRWMTGATMTAPCSETKEHIWTCSLSRPGGYTAQAVWSEQGTDRFIVPKQFTQALDLAGNMHPVINRSVILSNQPVLFQTGAF